MTRSCWGNEVIEVDLTTGRITKESVGEDAARRFLAGRGLADWLLFGSVEPGRTDPLGPDNVLVFSSGLLVGTPFPGAVRTSVVSLNVLTRGYGESSSSGSFATRLKKAGYDALVVKGRSPELCFLWIDDDRIELRNASGMAGTTTFAAAAAVKEELGTEDLSTCTIGPAGEKLVRYAVINCDNRYLGRCGLGAVMGSKNLKAIAVRGTGSVEPVRKERYGEILHGLRSLTDTDETVKRQAARGSLAGGAVDYNESGNLPVRNFQEVDFDRASTTGYEHVKGYVRGVLHCPTRCPVLCDRIVEISEGDPYTGTRVSSMQATPAYNTTKLLIGDMPTTIKVFEMCNAWGIDIHSWTCVMGWAIECYERGMLSREDTDGLELRWGDGPLAVESVRRIARREGRLGDLLAEGVALSSARIGRGSKEYAMHIKGMELDDELRVDKGEALGILAETRGSGHTLSTPGRMARLTPQRAKEIYGTEKAADPHAYEGKPEMVALSERHKAMLDCFGICFFSEAVQDCLLEYLFSTRDSRNCMAAHAQMVAAATGWDVTKEELGVVAERMMAVEQSINILAGIRREHEMPPRRFFEPIPGGRSKGMALDRGKTAEMLARHSALHGWDPQTGVPTRARLLDLGLPEVAARLEGFFASP